MRVHWRLACASLVVIALGASLAHAQRSFRAAPPESTKLQTKDGMGLSITYYASSLGKEATPVVLLHDHKDTQGMFSTLAARLQSPGEEDRHSSFAVVTVDLRGHGSSTQQTAPDGSAREIDAAKLTKNDVVAMSAFDMEAVRSFLVGKNDDEQLNLNKLCLVGAGMGATVAVNWAAQDWSAPPLLIGKQGQDVKAMVLVSPPWKYRGVPLQQAMRFQPLKQRVAWMIIYGKDDSGNTADARRIYKQLERFHPEPERSQSSKPRGLAEIALPTTLQGARLLGQAGQPLEDEIIGFLTVHVADQELPWIKRRHRLDQ